MPCVDTYDSLQLLASPPAIPDSNGRQLHCVADAEPHFLGYGNDNISDVVPDDFDSNLFVSYEVRTAALSPGRGSLRDT